ncbi:glycosyltransferase family 2 protein, partial [Actinomyces urogenitalis]|nr:glycosyltransferase family 2 protein [Actinomyces urogenitalis]
VAFISGLLGGLRLSDAHNGLRALNRDAFSHVHLHHNRMAHASEINSQLARTHLPYAEYPVHITYSDYSQAKGQSLLNGVNI